jgi:DNA repair exonuclease SbcCD nuclease subunit
MKLLIVSDLHLTDRPEDEYRWEVFTKIGQVCGAYSVDRVVILGDLTDSKDRHSSALVNRIVDSLVELTNRAPALVTVVKGNHDFMVDEDCPFFRFLNHIPMLEFVVHPTAVRMPDGFKMYYLPFSRTPLPKREDVDWELVSESNLILAHLTFNGSELSNGSRLEGGDDPYWFTRKVSPSAVVISGDVHVPQTVGLRQQPITYVGAPYHVRFGDGYTGRMLLVSVDASKTVRLKPIPLNEFPSRISARIRHVEAIKSMNLMPGDQLKLTLILPRNQRWTDDLLDQVRTEVAETGADLMQLSIEVVKRVSLRDTESSEYKTEVELVREFGDANQLEAHIVETGEQVVGGE